MWAGAVPSSCPSPHPIEETAQGGELPAQVTLWDSGLICLAPKSLLPPLPINPGQANPQPRQGCGRLRRGEAATRPPSLLCLKPQPDNTYSGCYPAPPCLSDPCRPPLIAYYCPFPACGLVTRDLLSQKHTPFLPTSGPWHILPPHLKTLPSLPPGLSSDVPSSTDLP